MLTCRVPLIYVSLFRSTRVCKGFVNYCLSVGHFCQLHFLSVVSMTYICHFFRLLLHIRVWYHVRPRNHMTFVYMYIVVRDLTPPQCVPVPSRDLHFRCHISWVFFSCLLRYDYYYLDNIEQRFVFSTCCNHSSVYNNEHS
jgi:hypothetical protein